MDVKNILDPNTRFIFLTFSDFTHAYPLVHVKDNLIFFTSEKPLPHEFTSGHFLAQENAGIVQFSNAQVQTLKNTEKQDTKLLLHMLDCNKMDYAITNRRLTQRYEFKEFIPITFHVYGDLATAQLINISEGGLRIRLNTPLNKNVVCHFQITLPLKKEALVFETDGIVVYSDREPKQNNFIAGISFVTPEFKNDNEKAAYLKAKTNIKEFVNSKM